MTRKKMHPCPVFPDMPCPQGQEMSEACTVRINGDYDPMADFRDHLLVHCAINQNQQRIKKEKTKEE